MTDEQFWHDFGYVHTDIPAGMTIGEWRRKRAAERAEARLAAGAARRPSALGRRLLRIWMRAVRQAHQPTPPGAGARVVPGPVRQP
jgi:hypothetical protein